MYGLKVANLVLRLGPEQSAYICKTPDVHLMVYYYKFHSCLRKLYEGYGLIRLLKRAFYTAFSI